MLTSDVVRELLSRESGKEGYVSATTCAYLFRGLQLVADFQDFVKSYNRFRPDLTATNSTSAISTFKMWEKAGEEYSPTINAVWTGLFPRSNPSEDVRARLFKVSLKFPSTSIGFRRLSYHKVGPLGLEDVILPLRL